MDQLLSVPKRGGGVSYMAVMVATPNIGEQKMTEAEKREIVQAVLAEMNNSARAVTARGLTPTHDKWFRDELGTASTSLMGKAFGNDGTRAYAIWELTRRATCAICGARYVNQLKDLDEANKVADKICQTIYDLAIERNKR